MDSQYGDCWWPLNIPPGVSVAMYKLSYTLISPVVKGHSIQFKVWAYYTKGIS